MTSTQYRIGSTITYRSNGGDLRTGVVLYKSANIKDGEAGFDLDDAWGYDDRIVRVDKY